MFESLTSLIDSRLGQNIVINDYMNDDDGFFIQISPSQLYSVAFFLKNDPDVRLTLLDQIIALPHGFMPWPSTSEITDHSVQVLYQLKSLKLPYRVTLVIDVNDDAHVISITPLYAGARWLEADISTTFGISFEDGEKR